MAQNDYLIFGAQYYRAPSPPEKDWDRDLARMSELGFNTVKFWVQWRWNNPQEGKFYFNDIDRLMDLAGKHKLRVMLNTIFDVAPAWIYRKYPDASMVTLDGRKVGPQTQPHRQIGGLGLCFNHEEAMEHLFAFLRETVERYKNHPALEIWNVGSEPELTSSMSELRLYADDAGKMGDMLCYCDICRSKFKNWLKMKYSEIDKLNDSWNRNYASFDDVELPITRNTFNDLIDWRMFFVHTLGENVKRRFEIAKEADRGKHRLMCHHVFVQGFPVVSTANDPWNVARFGDIHGITQMDDPMMVDVLRSSARDKPVISAEMLMLPGYTLDLPKTVDMNDVKRFVFTGIAANLKGFLFWQYRPELLGREAPTWGLTFPDGRETSWLQSYAEVGKVLQENSDLFLRVRPREAEVALVYNPENQIFAWASTGSEKSATGSLLGVHKALYDRNLNVDFIHPSDFDSGNFRRYKVIYFPFPYLLDEKIAESLKLWIHNGGALIAEAYFGGWDKESGSHSRVIPGYGFDKVFKALQGVVEPADAVKAPAVVLKKALPGAPAGTSAACSIVREALVPDGARVLAKFDSGEPAITMSEYGKGKAVLIGTYLGLSHHRSGGDAVGNLISGLVNYAAGLEQSEVVGRAKIRIDALTGGNNSSVVIFRNLTEKRAGGRFSIPGLSGVILTEMFSGKRLVVRQRRGSVAGEIQLGPREVRVYRA